MSPYLSHYTRPVLAGFLLAFLAVTPITPAGAEGMTKENPGIQIGEKAPDFTATDIYGDDISLSDYAGKKVVLEWTNHECPYVEKHYETGNMQGLQKDATDEGVIWLTVISSAPGRQGYLEPEDAQSILQVEDASPTTVLMDPDGDIGHAYNAQVTPHMYVIDEEGILAYKGAIDDNPSYEKETVEGAKNYVRAALNDLQNDGPVETPVTKAYGCSVKYAL